MNGPMFFSKILSTKHPGFSANQLLDAALLGYPSKRNACTMRHGKYWMKPLRHEMRVSGLLERISAHQTARKGEIEKLKKAKSS